MYGYRAELLKQVTIQKDDLEKFLEGIGINEEDVCSTLASKMKKSLKNNERRNA